MFNFKKMLMTAALTSTVFGSTLTWADEPSNALVWHPHNAPYLLSSVSNRFGARVLQRVVKSSGEGENVFFSPISLQLALGLLYTGADGLTKTYMASAFGLPRGLAGDGWHQATDLLLSRLEKNSEGLLVSINNAVFLDDKLPVRKEYVSLIESKHRAKVQNVDFGGAPQVAVDRINQWAADSTQNRIRNVIDKDTAEQLVALLANATYFKGVWAQEFDKKKTVEEDFILSSGQKIQTKMMHKVAKLLYAENQGAQVVSLPFKGESAELFLVLPPEDVNIKQWVGEKVLGTDFVDFTARNLDAKTMVNLSFPKFKFKTEMNLNGPLSALGLADLFSAPNLSKLSPANLSVGYVKQNTFVQVDEEGAEAAAVTTIGVIRTSVQPPLKLVSVKVDRPFFFAIRDRGLGTVLFSGIVENPVWK